MEYELQIEDKYKTWPVALTLDDMNRISEKRISEIAESYLKELDVRFLTANRVINLVSAGLDQILKPFSVHLPAHNHIRILYRQTL